MESCSDGQQKATTKNRLKRRYKEKAEPIRAPPPRYDRRTFFQLSALHVAYGVVLNEMFELRYLVATQLPKLHTASPHGYGTERVLVGLEIRNGLKWQAFQIEVTINDEYV
jgi:hypothetical protein